MMEKEKDKEKYRKYKEDENPNYLKVHIVVDKGLVNEAVSEIREIITGLNKLDLKVQANDEDKEKDNYEERITLRIKDENVRRIIDEGRIFKRLEIEIKKGEKTNLNSIKGETYKIKTKEEEDVKEIIEEIKDSIDLDELKLNLKKPKVIIEYNKDVEKIKIVIKQPKRDYFVFAHSRSIRPNIVRGLIKKIGLSKELKEGTAIDLTSISPFCLEAEGVNKNLNLFSWSWSSRITNLMRKNCLVAKDSRIKFDHGVLNELLKKYEDKITGKVFVFGQFLFVNEKVLGEIMKTINEIKSEKNKDIIFMFIFDKQLSEEFIKKHKIRENIICQGKRRLYIYSS